MNVSRGASCLDIGPTCRRVHWIPKLSAIDQVYYARAITAIWSDYESSGRPHFNQTPSYHVASSKTRAKGTLDNRPKRLVRITSRAEDAVDINGRSIQVPVAGDVSKSTLIFV